MTETEELNQLRAQLLEVVTEADYTRLSDRIATLERGEALAGNVERAKQREAEKAEREKAKKEFDNLVRSLSAKRARLEMLDTDNFERLRGLLVALDDYDNLDQTSLEAYDKARKLAEIYSFDLPAPPRRGMFGIWQGNIPAQEQFALWLDRAMMHVAQLRKVNKLDQFTLEFLKDHNEFYNPFGG